ncbi:unnamed protein product [Allacma fusca]|uniref:Uncharacterized protein n=1 Tax=Allacma fusca TaxID=39272 RepID=A0A8J2KHI3_9HEXA|nr:unnamed protein product [Allacma fusca]
MALVAIALASPYNGSETLPDQMRPARSVGSLTHVEKLVLLGRTLVAFLEEKCPRANFKKIISALEYFHIQNFHQILEHPQNDELMALTQSISQCPNDTEFFQNFQHQGTKDNSSGKKPKVLTLHVENKDDKAEHGFIKWVTNTWSRIKSFFRDLFHQKTVAKRSVDDEGSDKSFFQTILDGGLNIGEEGRKRGRNVLINAMRIYGHSCPMIEAQVRTFDGVVRELLKYLDDSDFFAMYVRTIVDEKFLKEFKLHEGCY